MELNTYLYDPTTGKRRSQAERLGIAKAQPPVKPSVSADQRDKLRKSEELGRRRASESNPTTQSDNPWTNLLGETERRKGSQSNAQIKRWEKNEKHWEKQNRAKLEADKAEQTRLADPAFVCATEHYQAWSNLASRHGIDPADTAYAKGLLEGGALDAFWAHVEETNSAAYARESERKQQLLANAAPMQAEIIEQSAIVDELKGAAE